MNSTFKMITDLYQLLRNTDQGQLVLDGKAKLTLPVFVLEKLNCMFTQVSTSTEGLTTELLQNILYLQDFVSKTPKLKLSHSKGPLPSVVDITRFVNLRYIELIHIKLQNVKGIQALRPQLELLICTSSTDSFEDVLAGDSNSLQVWEELRTVDLSNNKIEDILGNKTFISTPWIQHLDLSMNKLTYVGGSLDYLNNLKYLNLSYNQLDSLPFLSHESSKKLEILLLCHNLIEDISGIWIFSNLNKLDLSYNLLDDHVNLTSLSELKKLQWLSLVGSPLSYHRYHRTYTCACLSKAIPVQSIILDNKKLSSNEIKVLGTRGGRTIQPSSYKAISRRESENRRYRRTASTSSSVNSYNTVISANVHQPGNTGKNEPLGDAGSTCENSAASTSGTQNEDKLFAGNPSMSRSLSSSGRKMPKIREAVILDVDEVAKAPSPLPQPLGNDEHLEMKKEVEELRQRYGEDHWLHSHAGSFVQDLLGFQKTPRSSSILSEMTSSQVSLKEENQLQSKLNDIKDNQMPSNDEGKSNVERISQSNDVSPTKSGSGVDSSSSAFSPDYHGSDNSGQMLTSGDENNTFGNVFSNQKRIDELSTEVVAGASTVDEGYDDEEDDVEDPDLCPWLVQKVLPGKLEEVFIFLKDKEILEKNPLNNRTLVRWGLSTLLSCEKISAQPPTVQLTFDTVRRNCDKRIYIMEPAESQELLQRLGEVLESRPLSAMNQFMFKCMKCSSLFSRELKTTIINLVGGFDLTCEVCGSTLVAKIDENDDELSSISKNSNSNNAINNKNKANNSTAFSADSNNSNNVTSTNSSSVVPSAQPKLSASPSQCSIGSAASLDQSSSRESPAAGLGDSNNAIMTSHSVRGDSDIEIISNPSQSSIEVLEVQARLQGTNTPNRKRSSEERQTVAVPQLMTVPEVISNTGVTCSNSANAGTLLTESSSSGSLTDSICTAYENHPPVNNSRRLPSQGSVADKLIEETSADNSPESKGSDNFIMQPPPSSGKGYNSILQDLLNSVNSKLESPDGTKAAVTPTNLDNDRVCYNYTNFSEVDHRIKLFLYEKLFENDDEELILLLRADVMDKNNVFYPGCLVISTHSCFLLKITGEECGDDAGSFLEKVISVILSKFQLSRVSWDQSVLMTADNQYLLILHDLVRTNDFLKFVANVQRNTDSIRCLSDDENETISSLPYVDSDRYMVLQNVLSANNDIKDSNNICTFSITCSTLIKRDNENDVILPFACIANTSCDLFILKNDLSWLYKEDVIPAIYTVHNIMNLIDVGLQGYQLSLHFLDESEGIEESWLLTFETISAINIIIESIRKPWEDAFSVPLQVTHFSNCDMA